MLDDMPKASGTSLVAEPGDQFGAVDLPPAKKGRAVATPRPRRFRREKVIKESALGALLKPIGISLALVLSAYALLSLGTTFYRSYQRHLDHTAPIHADESVLDVILGTSNLPADPVDLVVKDVDGTLHKMVVSKSEADKFVNGTILMLDDERARIKKAAHEDLDRAFAQAFQDREQAISNYADWFFEWKRSYVVLKELLTSAITRFFEAGKYELLTEAIEADVKDYFLRNYKEQVLKPELRDQTIGQGVEQAARHAHDSYRRVIANGDMRLQLFIAQHTSHLEDIPAAAPMTNVKLDWDAQKWKAPVYLMEDRAFDGIAGLGAAAAGGAVGALALGPALNGGADPDLRAAFAPLRHLARHAACLRPAGRGCRHNGAADGRAGDRRGNRRRHRRRGRLSEQRRQRGLQSRRVRSGECRGARRHHRHLESDSLRQYRHGHR